MCNNAERFAFLTAKSNKSVLDVARTVNDGDFDASRRSASKAAGVKRGKPVDTIIIKWAIKLASTVCYLCGLIN
jgi:hypothetical protein